MKTTVPYNRPEKYDVLINVHEADHDGTRAVTLIFNDRVLERLPVTGHEFQRQLAHLEESTGVEFELLNGSRGPFVMCEGSKELLAQGLLSVLIGKIGLRARVVFVSGKPRLTPI